MGRNKPRGPFSDIMTVTMVAEYSGYSIPAVYKDIKQGVLKVHWLPNVYLILRSDYMVWIKEKTGR